MYPPHFDNPWILIFLIYGYPLLPLLLRAHWQGRCEVNGRKLSFREWIKGA